MTTMFVIMFVTLAGFLVLFDFMTSYKKKSKLKRGIRTGSSAKLAHNGRGEYLIYNKDGSVSTDINALLRSPKVQDDIRAAGRLYKMMVLKALLTGEEPPKQYGDFLPMTKERLLAEWDDDWQAVMDNVGLNYNEFFGFKEELTAEEIASQYVEKERTSKSTIRGYARSNRSLRL